MIIEGLRELLKKERAMREKVREGSTKSKGGLYKMPQNPTLPQSFQGVA